MIDAATLEALRAALADRYRIGAVLGTGASATVFAAEDRKHHRPVAIKVLRPELAATLTRERFLREIAIVAKLQHPHILPVLDSGEAAGSVYFVMPLLEGRTLRQRLAEPAPLTLAETLRILVDVADALGYAHERQVIHRDIKPDNIMLTGRHAVVMDFGVAKALDDSAAVDRNLTSGIALGTPTYMAPEQATARPDLDHRVDVYALGVVGYEILAGRPPFVGATPQDVLTAHVVLSPEPIGSRRPDLPPAVTEVIDRCLAKSPADRWPAASAITERLETFAATPASVTPPNLRPTSARRAHRATWLVAGIGLLGIVALLWDQQLRRSAGGTPVVRPERLSFLGTVREAALSPDGALLGYVTAGAGGQQLWVQDTRGGNPIPIASSERIVGLAWTADGSELSYTEGPADEPVTRITRRLGGGSRILGRGRGLISPDGQLVLLATGGDPVLRVIRRASGDSLALDRPSDGWLTGVAWSPGSDRLLLSIAAPDRATSTVMTLGLDGTREVVATESRTIYGPAWAPDGRAIYYLADARPSGRDLVRVVLDRRGRADGRPTLVAAGVPALDESRRWPTGTFLSIGDGGRRMVMVQDEQWSNLAQIPIPRRADRRIVPALLTMGTALYTAPRLAPDGRRIAVFMSTARGTSLGTVTLEGNLLDELAIVAGPGVPAWSPDGAMLAFTAVIADTGNRLSITDLATGVTRRLGGGVGLEVTWERAGIVVQRAGNRGLLTVGPDADQVGPPVAGTVGSTFQPRLSPDGRWIATLTFPGGAGPVALELVSRTDSTRRTLLPGSYRPLGWSTRGDTLFAVRNSFAPAPEEVMAVPLDGGPPRRVATLPAGFTAEDLSRDGRLLIASQIQSRSDTWQIILAPGPR